MGAGQIFFHLHQRLPEARDDLIAGFRFYECQAPGLGSYFREISAMSVTIGQEWQSAVNSS